MKVRELYNIWLSVKAVNPTHVNKVIINKIESNGNKLLNEQDKEKIKSTLKKFNKKWVKCSRMKLRFESSNNIWLDTDMRLGVNDFFEEPSTSGSRGRPRKSFEESCNRTKRRRVDELVTSNSSELIKKAAEKLTILSNQSTISVKEALGLYVDMDLSYRTYNMMRNLVNSFHKDCFPSYKALFKSKQELIPHDIEVTESSAEIPLQSLLNQTAKSLMDSHNLCPKKDITLECKWGFDGSSNHSVYKQKFSNPRINDEFIFVASLVPLRFFDPKTSTTLWENDRHSSPRYCRPIKFMFMKENPDLVRDVERNISLQIESLNSFHHEEKNVNVSFSMKLTMIDGAVLNVLTNNKSSSNCCICGAKPTEMNSTAVSERDVNEEHYKYGLSTLHARIKFFECILHIAYKLKVRKWRVSKEQEKQVVSETKSQIQKKIKEQLGLIVDKVKNGYGTTNDGNSARTFFSNIEIASKITGVDNNLIRNFSIILRTISSGSKINIENFDTLLKETRDLYLSKGGNGVMP
ncbi:uncharacterized protein LOC131997013 [Stomoxys calcitrans]|uniref:uncharacterized protein LOC131997013 n=1 Tax=Stomoxys calcitrans TaxID=35570 RepID=UPI0027E27539|nr:uncharacterized protein LOC131997013 [Stomoxys calcitrans]